MSSKGQKIILLRNEVYGKNKPFVLDGFDNAIIGIDVIGERLIYSTKKCISLLKKQMPTEEAIAYFYTEIFDNEEYKKSVIFCEDRIKELTNDNL